jgi:hypothetical protein
MEEDLGSVPYDDEDSRDKHGVQHALKTNVHRAVISLTRDISYWPFPCVSDEEFRCKGTVRSDGDW